MGNKFEIGDVGMYMGREYMVGKYSDIPGLLFLKDERGVYTPAFEDDVSKLSDTDIVREFTDEILRGKDGYVEYSKGLAYWVDPHQAAETRLIDWMIDRICTGEVESFEKLIDYINKKRKILGND